MGFGRNRATRAVQACGRLDAGTAVNWLMERIDDLSLDAPLPSAHSAPVAAAAAPAAPAAAPAGPPTAAGEKKSKSQLKRERKKKREGKM